MSEAVLREVGASEERIQTELRKLRQELAPPQRPEAPS